MKPYPEHLISTFQLTDGTVISIRPIKPDDAEMIQEFVRNLSSQTKHAHFMENFRELTSKMLTQLTKIDYENEMVFIATNKINDKETTVGIARYIANTALWSCESIVVVADAWQNKGIATRLMDALIEAAKKAGLKEMMGTILASNVDMLKLAKHLGFMISNSDDPTVKIATKVL